MFNSCKFLKLIFSETVYYCHIASYGGQHWYLNWLIDCFVSGLCYDKTNRRGVVDLSTIFLLTKFFFQICSLSVFFSFWPVFLFYYIFTSVTHSHQFCAVFISLISNKVWKCPIFGYNCLFSGICQVGNFLNTLRVLCKRLCHPIFNHSPYIFLSIRVHCATSQLRFLSIFLKNDDENKMKY